MYAPGKEPLKVSIVNTTSGTIEYSMTGKGQVILIIHGGHVNCRETIFQKGLDLNEVCVITPSRPGYGNTPLTADNKTPEGTARLVIALLDALNIHRVMVVGISAGGLTALEMAARHPDRVSKLMLLSALTKKWFAETNKVYKLGKKAFAPHVETFTWFLYRQLFRLVPAMMTKVMFKELSAHRPVAFTNEELEELRGMTMHMRSGRGFSNDLDQTIKQEILSSHINTS